MLDETTAGDNSGLPQGESTGSLDLLQAKDSDNSLLAQQKRRQKGNSAW